MAQPDPANVEITTVSLKPGIAVLFGNGGNIGVSYGSEGTVLIDDQFAELTAKIQAAVAELGARPVEFLINTHWHFDHAGGNENFGAAGARIFAHTNVRKRLAEGGVVLGGEIPAAAASALPIVTYDRGLTIHLNGDDIDVMFLGGGHTDGDSVIKWRKANVVHTGDLFMNGMGFPFIDLESGGNVEHLLTSLEQVIAMVDDETIIIPGHGKIANRSDLVAFRKMVATAVDRIRILKARGSGLDETLAARPLAGLRNADGFVTDDEFVKAIWESLDENGD